jgi:hypothetical protein
MSWSVNERREIEYDCFASFSKGMPDPNATETYVDGRRQYRDLFKVFGIRLLFLVSGKGAKVKEPLSFFLSFFLSFHSLLLITV